ncbi:hypothetical protein MMC09_002479 [Bachmanniomyces sp. S44760]|nr:hypothetical protein [Bachmanniomyces sp. S44760]
MPIFSGNSKATGTSSNRNLLFEPTVDAELSKAFPSLRRVIMKSVESNAVVPSLSATLEYLKISNSTSLPTSFYEAELDYFGKHMFDDKADGPGKPVTGKHHFEWKPA